MSYMLRPADVPVGLAILLGVAILFFSAWYAAWKLLSPRDVFGLKKKCISKLEYCRSLGGLVVIIGATLKFRGSPRVLADLVLHVSEALVLGGVALFVCIIFAVTMARPRRPLIARIWRPLVKIALTFLPALAAIALFRVPIVTNLLNTKQPTLKGAFVDSIGGWLILVVFWLLIFTLCALCYSARYFYCAGEVHPLLAPLVAIVAVTMIAVLDIGRPWGWLGGIETLVGKVVGRGTPSFLLHPTPPWLALTLIVSGWASTIILAGFEWHTLRGAGVSFRKDPDFAAALNPADPFTQALQLLDYYGWTMPELIACMTPDVRAAVLEQTRMPEAEEYAHAFAELAAQRGARWPPP